MRIRLLTQADVAVGMKLGTQNGWNQLERDWLRFLEMQPDGCFLAEIDGKGVGTACACTFGPVAWVALVLVDSGCRNQGIGTALMRHVLQFLDDLKIPTIRLDATPLGRPIYEKLGFSADYELARFEGVLSKAIGSAQVDGTTAEDLAAICRLDASISGTERSKFLSIVFAEDPRAVRVVRDESGITGFLASRPGARAAQIGPCIADDAAGPQLFADAFQRFAGQRVYVDVPVQNSTAQNLARSAGLTVQRHLLRMTRGPRVLERVGRLWASSGPEKG